MDRRGQGYRVVQLEEIEPVACPCGWSRRAFLGTGDGVASLHLVEITSEAKSHYHRKTTEIYYILAGEGWIELDGEKIEVRPGTSVMILPGTRHRAIGPLRLLNIAIPGFDPEDEFLDDDTR